MSILGNFRCHIILHTFLASRKAEQIGFHFAFLLINVTLRTYIKCLINVGSREEGAKKKKSCPENIWSFRGVKKHAFHKAVVLETKYYLQILILLSVFVLSMDSVIKLSYNALRFSSQRALPPTHRLQNKGLSFSPVDCVLVAPIASRPSNRFGSLKMHATITETEQPKWWERNAGPNMIDIHSTQEFLNALSQAGDKLVIVEFYGTWCASCRALFPKLCRTANEYPEILFLKINYDENKAMCKSLNVKVLPYFHFYRGADGQLESFSCSLAKFQKIRDAIDLHNTARCSIGPNRGIGDLKLESFLIQKEKQPESSIA